jgi:hypothetical protein
MAQETDQAWPQVQCALGREQLAESVTEYFEGAPKHVRQGVAELDQCGAYAARGASIQLLT